MKISGGSPLKGMGGEGSIREGEERDPPGYFVQGPPRSQLHQWLFVTITVGDVSAYSISSCSVLLLFSKMSVIVLLWTNKVKTDSYTIQNISLLGWLPISWLLGGRYWWGNNWSFCNGFHWCRERTLILVMLSVCVFLWTCDFACRIFSNLSRLTAGVFRWPGN